jgi:hypothetical protein
LAALETFFAIAFAKAIWRGVVTPALEGFIGLASAVINVSIAIVVEVVTDGIGMPFGGLFFGAGYHKAEASAPSSFGLADLFTCLTSADAFCIIGAGITFSLSTGFTGAVDAIIDSAVAVVIEAIADLTAGESLIVALTPTVVGFAVLDAKVTKTRALCADGTGVTASSLALCALTLQAFIDLAIAIVIESIAGFILGEMLADAGAPCGADLVAPLLAFFTKTRFKERFVPVVTLTGFTGLTKLGVALEFAAVLSSLAVAVLAATLQTTLLQAYLAFGALSVFCTRLFLRCSTGRE